MTRHLNRAYTTTQPRLWLAYFSVSLSLTLSLSLSLSHTHTHTHTHSLSLSLSPSPTCEQLSAMGNYTLDGVVYQQNN